MKAKESPEKPTHEAFIAYLRSALHYLYDPVQLRRSPLVVLLGFENEFQQAAAMQRLLTEAILELKPAVDEPPQSAAWRIYDILSLLYVRQFTRDTVANQLGISERQLRREQRQALEALAQVLWEKARPAKEKSDKVDEPVQEAQKKDQMLREELDWLETAGQDQRILLGDVLKTVISLAKPLAEKRQVELRLKMDPKLSSEPAQQNSVRHIMLTLLNTLIPITEGGQITIQAARQENTFEIRVAPAAVKRAKDIDADKQGIEIVSRLAAFYGVAFHSNPDSILLAFSAPQQIPVMVIDDNADWLEMLKRFTAGTHYRIIGTRKPEAAARLIHETQPAVIFLDVMMPGIDGWQVLSELHNAQSERPIPIVVCSVLPLEDLALSLGVRAFLQKPVTQDQFINIIEKLTAETKNAAISRTKGYEGQG